MQQPQRPRRTAGTTNKRRFSNSGPSATAKASPRRTSAGVTLIAPDGSRASDASSSLTSPSVHVPQDTRRLSGTCGGLRNGFSRPFESVALLLAGDDAALIAEENGRDLQQEQIRRAAKTGSRADVEQLHNWTHEQLAEIHRQHQLLASDFQQSDQSNFDCNGTKMCSKANVKLSELRHKKSVEQIKVLDFAMEQLSKMVEVHSNDKAALLRRIWSSSADLFNSTYSELSGTIQTMRVQLLDQQLACERMEKLVASAHASGAASIGSTSRTKQQSSLHDTERASVAPKSSSAEDLALIRELEEELLLKNQEILDLEGVLTSLSVWFPNFSKFHDSIIRKYLPPVDVDFSDESRSKSCILDGGNDVQEAAQQKVWRRLLGIKGDSLEDEAHDDMLSEMQQLQTAQSHLLADLKRLQRIGIGFAVLDPLEYEAANRAILDASTAQHSRHQGNKKATFDDKTQSFSSSTAVNVENNAEGISSLPFPPEVLTALKRTSTIVTDAIQRRDTLLHGQRNQGGNTWSFSEVVDGEYDLHRETFDEQPDDGSEEEDSDSPEEHMTVKLRPALRVEADDAEPSSLVGVTQTPTQARVSDFLKLQSERFSAMSGQRTSRRHAAANDTELTTKQESLPRKPRRNIDTVLNLLDIDASDAAKAEHMIRTTTNCSNTPPEDSNDCTARIVKEGVYETKFRQLLVDAQLMESAAASMQRQLQEEGRQHRQEVRTLQAEVCSLRRRLESSQSDAQILSHMLPPILFPPLLPSAVNVMQKIPTYAEMQSLGFESSTGQRHATITSLGGNSSHETQQLENFEQLPSALMNVGKWKRPARINYLTQPPVDMTPAADTAAYQRADEQISVSTTDQYQEQQIVLPLHEIERQVIVFFSNFCAASPSFTHSGDHKGRSRAVRDELNLIFGLQGAEQCCYDAFCSSLSGQSVHLFRAQIAPLPHAEREPLEREVQDSNGHAVSTVPVREPSHHLFGWSESRDEDGCLPVGSSLTSIPELFQAQQQRQHFDDDSDCQRQNARSVEQSTPQAASPQSYAHQILNSSTLSAHLFTFFCSKARCTGANNHGLYRLLRIIISLQHYAGNVLDCGAALASPGSGQEMLLVTLLELFNLISDVVTKDHINRQEAMVSIGWEALPWQRDLRQQLYFDIFVHSYKSMQRYFQKHNAHGKSFPIHATARILKRIFFVIETGEMQINYTSSDRPWWRCLTPAVYEVLRSSVELSAVNILGSQSKLNTVGTGNEGTWIDCYRCVRLCMTAVQEMHRMLMRILMNVFDFLQSLASPMGSQSRTFHALLAFILQTNLAFNIHCDLGDGDGGEEHTARGIRHAVVNLAIVEEMNRLFMSRQLCAEAFADLVLRSQPAGLVDTFLCALEPNSQKTASTMPRISAQGKRSWGKLQRFIKQAKSVGAENDSSALKTAASNSAASESREREVARKVVEQQWQKSLSSVKAGPDAGISTEQRFCTESNNPQQDSHFKRSAIVNRLLYAVEVPVTDCIEQRAEGNKTKLTREEYDLLLDSTGFSASSLIGTNNVLLQRISMHALLSFDEKISETLPPTHLQVLLTTRALQYIVGVLQDLLVHSSRRLKHILNRSEGDISSTIIADLVLQSEFDFDTLLRVENHYMQQVQRKAFRAWSALIDENG